MNEDDRVRLLHMIDAAREALAFTKNKQRRDLEADRMLALALVKEIEIIGEAASKVSDAFRSSHPQFPWPKVIGMRHRLVHAYFEIDHGILWTTVTEALPAFIGKIDEMLKPEA